MMPTEEVEIFAILLKDLDKKFPFTDVKEFVDEIESRRVIYKDMKELGEPIYKRNMELSFDREYSLSDSVEDLHKLLKHVTNYMSHEHPVIALFTIEREHWNERLVCTIYDKHVRTM